MEQNFEKIKSKISPDPSFVQNLEGRLKKSFRAGHAPHSFAFFNPFTMKSRKLVTAVLVAVVLLGGGLSAYAYESPDVTNGNPLYGLKRTIESIEGSLATSDEAQAEFHLKMTLRRVEEIKILAARGIEDPATMAEIDTESAAVLAKFDKIANDDVRARVIANFKNGLTRHLDTLPAGTGSGTVVNANTNDFKNYGQERSSEVNKGQQGERMKSENASNRVKEKLEEKLARVVEKEQGLDDDSADDEAEDDDSSNSNTNGNENKNNSGQERSGEVNKGQQGIKKSTENANPQSNMNEKVGDRDEDDRPANTDVNNSGDTDNEEEEDEERGRNDSSERKSGEKEDD